MLLPLVTYYLFNGTKTGAAGIYDAVGKVFSWQQMPREYGAGVFFGFSGFDRKAMEYTIDTMRANYGEGWYNSDNATTQGIFTDIANAVSAETGADANGIKTFCNWVFIACKRDNDVWNYLSGGTFDTFDALKKKVSTDVESLEQGLKEAAETIEYGLSQESGFSINFDKYRGVLPVIAILAGLLVVKKIID